MSSTPVPHPDDRLLIAFNLGKLDDREAAGINKHLKECQACRRRLVRLSSEANVPAATAPAGGIDSLAAAVQADRQDGSAIFQNTRAQTPAGMWTRFVWPSAGFGLLLLGLAIAWLAGAFKAKMSAGTTPSSTAVAAVENRPVPAEAPTLPATDQPTPAPSSPAPKTTASLPPAVQNPEINEPPKAESPADRAIQAAINEASRPEARPEPVAPTETPPKETKEPAQEFFNGKDLAGWKGAADVWHVENGAITGSLPVGQKQSAFLCSQQKYKDFDLRFRATVADGIGDCGVQFRSLMTDSAKSLAVGPQCAIYGKDAPKDHRTGSLVTEPEGKIQKAPQPKRVERFVKPMENHFRIRCQGKHVLIEVNGIKMVNGEFPSLPDEGLIAWTIDGNRPPHKVTFKITKFTVLSEAPPQLAAERPSLQDPELLKAELTFQNTIESADKSLLKQFEDEINKLTHSNRPGEKLVAPVVDHEKQLFTEKGFIPFSRPMRKPLLQYGKKLREAQRTVGNAFDRAIDRAERSHNQKLIEALRDEAGQVLSPREVAIWETKDGRGNAFRKVFYSDGTFVNTDRPDAEGSRFWMPFAEDGIVLEYPDSQDSTVTNQQGFQLSPDGKTLKTLNKKGDPVVWQYVEE